MLIEVPEKVAKKIVVKRDGKKVEFDGAKIALAIQKGFGDIVGNEDPKTAKYNETDVNKVYSKVLGRIEKIDSDKIKINYSKRICRKNGKRSRKHLLCSWFLNRKNRFITTS